MCYLSLCVLDHRDQQIPGVGSLWPLNFVRWRIMFVDPQYGIPLISLFLAPRIFTYRFPFFGRFLDPTLQCTTHYGIEFFTSISFV